MDWKQRSTQITIEYRILRASARVLLFFMLRTHVLHDIICVS
uniref:Uncharacterized protein n=1 Tax=virus sp. ctFlR8 TaxID=2825811 RepID=A0A8S5RNV3_9VIRU|nr:MAG TPA: hypothetical protein [virus sp. ctFlR8]DAI07248.1 MAG TPA: hypothetical protein [Bacteriophage sp.]DAU08871.1 MAG TPA: hypothetical protein [Caudoviricetes sp.]DAZ21910.1 MAG TPA: hypothetical protein [Caudoviricetes sp.]